MCKYCYSNKGSIYAKGLLAGNSSAFEIASNRHSKYKTNRNPNVSVTRKTKALTSSFNLSSRCTKSCQSALSTTYTTFSEEKISVSV